MKKKLVAVFLVLVMAVCIFPVSAFADSCTYDAVSITGTRNLPAGVTPQYSYYVMYSDRNHWVGWTRPNSRGAVRVAQGYLYQDNSYSEYASQNPGFVLNVDSCVDGWFGEATEATIRIYQRKHGLSIDGDLGTNTWRNMAYYNYKTTIGHLLPYDGPF